MNTVLPIAALLLSIAAIAVTLAPRPPPPLPPPAAADTGPELAALRTDVAGLRAQIEELRQRPQVAPAASAPLDEARVRELAREIAKEEASRNRFRPPGMPAQDPAEVKSSLIQEAKLDDAEATKVIALLDAQREAFMKGMQNAMGDREAMQTLFKNQRQAATEELAKILDAEKAGLVQAWMAKRDPMSRTSFGRPSRRPEGGPQTPGTLPAPAPGTVPPADAPKPTDTAKDF